MRSEKRYQRWYHPDFSLVRCYRRQYRFLDHQYLFGSGTNGI